MEPKTHFPEIVPVMMYGGDPNFNNAPIAIGFVTFEQKETYSVGTLHFYDFISNIKTIKESFKKGELHPLAYYKNCNDDRQLMLIFLFRSGDYAEKSIRLELYEDEK